MIEKASSTSSVNIKGLGWFIFGQFGSNFETSQKLESLDSTWCKGPAVLAKGLYGQCVVQVIVRI